MAEQTQHREVPKDERHKPGTVIKIVTADAEFDAVQGQEYVVETYVPIKEGDAEPPQPYYMLQPVPGRGFGEVFSSVHGIEVVRTADEQAEKMKPVQAEEITKVLMSLICDDKGDIDINETRVLKTAPEKGDGFETDHGYLNGVEFYGRREGGASFGGIIRLTAFWQTDDD